MVWVSRVALSARAGAGRGGAGKPIRPHLRSRFLDSLRLHVKGGSGGAGMPRYGGTGGQGGAVYCVGVEGASLKDVLTDHSTKSAVAGHGDDSCKQKIVGAPGRDLKLQVPLGLSIYGEKGRKLGDVNEEGDTCILARGGPGGNKDNGFLGSSGQNHHVWLDLRLIADVGLVGFPNAGKSSLLKALSRAKPRIANYPFTTIKPNLGMMEFKDYRQITVADLPGLIEGAHVNVGLGHTFLKHVERTKLLLLVADVNGFALSQMHRERSCLETVLLLNKELELYNSDLLKKPAMLAINKLDLDGAGDAFKRIKESILNIEKNLDSIPAELRPEKLIQFEDIVGISALQGGESIAYLKNLIRKRLDDYAENTDSTVEEPAHLFRKNKELVRERGPQVT